MNYQKKENSWQEKEIELKELMNILGSIKMKTSR